MNIDIPITAPLLNTHASRFNAALNVLTNAIEAGAFPGCAFGVLAGGGAAGEVVLAGALGRFRYESDSALVLPATVFDVASITKVAATTAIAMLLHQRGKLDLETPLGDVLPEFVVSRSAETSERSSNVRYVTLRNLLAHNSGLPGYVKLFRTATDPAELSRACLQLPLEAQPGTRAEYSDPGFIVLGKALEVLIGESLASFAAREIYAPLGMTSTGFCPSMPLHSTIPPTEIDQTFRHRVIQGEVQDENAWVLGGVGGHAGLFSNVPDLLRFAAALLSANSFRNANTPVNTGDSLFTHATLDLFAQPQEPAGSSRALGWDTPSRPSSSGTYFSPHSIGHLGYSGCSLWIDLDAEVAIVLLTNRTWPDRASQLIRQVRPAFHDAVRAAL